MSVICPKCSSKDVRSYDNQPLFHPTRKQVKDGSMNHDNEVYMDFKCDDCENTFTKIFNLTPQ